MSDHFFKAELRNLPKLDKSVCNVCL